MWPCAVLGRLGILSGFCLYGCLVRERGAMIGWCLRSPFDLVLCEPLDDAILFVILVPNVLRGPLLGIAPPSIVLP